LNKRQLAKDFKELGLEPEDYQHLSRAEMQTLHDMLMLALTFEALMDMFRIAPTFKKMTDILQGKEINDE
jgi:ATP-dependent helicase/DNAse subunit B